MVIIFHVIKYRRQKKLAEPDRPQPAMKSRDDHTRPDAVSYGDLNDPSTGNVI